MFLDKYFILFIIFLRIQNCSIRWDSLYVQRENGFKKVFLQSKTWELFWDQVTERKND